MAEMTDWQKICALLETPGEGSARLLNRKINTHIRRLGGQWLTRLEEAMDERRVGKWLDPGGLVFAGSVHKGTGIWRLRDTDLLLRLRVSHGLHVSTASAASATQPALFRLKVGRQVVAPRTILRLLESTMPTTWERSKPHGWTAVHVAKTIHVAGQGHSIQVDVVPAIPCNKRGDVFLVPHGRLWKKYSMRADLERLPRRKGPLTALVRLLKAMSGILGLGVDGVFFEHLALAVVDDVDAFTWPGMPLAVRSVFVLLRTELATGSTSAGGRKKAPLLHAVYGTRLIAIPAKGKRAKMLATINELLSKDDLALAAFMQECARKTAATTDQGLHVPRKSAAPSSAPCDAPAPARRLRPRPAKRPASELEGDDDDGQARRVSRRSA